MGVPTHSLSNRKLWSVKHIPKTRINNDGRHPNINTHQNDISHSEKDCFSLKQPGDGSPMLGGQIQLRFFFYKFQKSNFEVLSGTNTRFITSTGQNFQILYMTVTKNVNGIVMNHRCQFVWIPNNQQYLYGSSIQVKVLG